MKLKLPKKSDVAKDVRDSISEQAEDTAIVNARVTPPTQSGPTTKLSSLIDGDFPFDESQRDAIDGLSEEQYACLTGAAGTGKTTVTKAIVDRLMNLDAFGSVDVAEYHGESTEDGGPEAKWVPSVAMGAFTGRATQMIKKNFPDDWHDNIMTIHRMLGYVPDRYQDENEYGDLVWKMRFVPTYTKDRQMPWDHIIVDEAGMLSVDLWENLYAAMKPDCRITFIGDINQLPPVHGKSVFGFAMSKWPSWELKKVHRQKGQENPIVDNAWRVINGVMPESEGRFQMMQLKGDAQYSSRHVRALLPKLQERGIYDPIRDSVITPINGEEGSRGFALGQLPLNRELSLIFNPSNVNPRYVIAAAREIKRFAIGDKVMATKNDWEHGITNGMTGVITDIEANPNFQGDWTRFGPVDEVNERMKTADSDLDKSENFSMDDFDNFEANFEKLKDEKESRERGPSSHIVTVRFGEGDYETTLSFDSLSELDSLMTAYVVTCHKMQGGEAPTVIIICHDAHKAILYREWLYTAITRASQKCILLFTPTALKTALNKQNIKGQSLRAKVESFNAIIGATRVTLPETTSTRNLIMNMEEEKYDKGGRFASTAMKQGGLAKLIKKQREAENEKPATPDRVVEVKVTTQKTFTIRTRTETKESSAPVEREVADGGRLIPQSQLPAPKFISTHGAVNMMYHLEDERRKLLLTHTPKPVNRLALKLGRPQ